MDTEDTAFTRVRALAEKAVATGDDDRAIELYSEFIRGFPNHAVAHYKRANLLKDRGQLELALAGYDRAIALHRSYAYAFCNRGFVLEHLGRLDAALDSLDKAIACNPEDSLAHFNRGAILRRLLQPEAALASYQRAIELNPDYAEAHGNRGGLLTELGRWDAALPNLDRALHLAPSLRFLAGVRRHAKMHVCDWSDFHADVERLTAGIAAEEKVSPPFPILSLVDSAPIQMKAAQIWARDEHRVEIALPAIAKYPKRAKIRLGYFSADFHEHPVALLAAPLFERHDRSNFELTAFSLGPDANDATRQRLLNAFDRFLDVRGKTAREIALLARELCIDIAIDLGGYTGGSRASIFALRAAPIQVNFLGYPGTMGASFMDYVVADRIVVPVSHQPHYSERIIYLEGSFLPGDAADIGPDTSPSRDELGLPATGFVYCCFNNGFKITPEVFDGWMRILRRTEGSVLWLSGNNPLAVGNLRAAALRRDTDPGRLIFAQRVPSRAWHLTRQRAADLFLDTRPYNAHTTALDALWAGLPVLTCLGNAFAGRVAASLLTAIDLPELIAPDPEHYEDLAVALAANPQRLADFKQKLLCNRHSSLVFDAAAFARKLEAAYARIYQRYRDDLAADHIEA